MLSRRLLLVTGKGGVGRTTVSAALALAGQQAGKRVLLLEISGETRDYSPLARLFGRDQLPEHMAEISPGIDGAQLLPLMGMELFVHSVLKVGAIARAAASSTALRRLLDAAPSFREMGLFYHLLTFLRGPHGLLVVDMPATGHTLALTGLPKVLRRVFPKGPIQVALKEGQDYLHDPKVTGAYAVALPETLVVTETLELLEQLTAQEIPVGGILLNKVLRNAFTPEEHQALTELTARHPILGADKLQQMAQAEEAVQRLHRSTSALVAALPVREEEGRPLAQALAELLLRPALVGGAS